MSPLSENVSLSLLLNIEKSKNMSKTVVKIKYWGSKSTWERQKGRARHSNTHSFYKTFAAPMSLTLQCFFNINTAWCYA